MTCHRANGSPKVPRTRSSYPRGVSDELLAEAYRMHWEGEMSAREVATEILDRTTYKSAAVAAVSLGALWRRRGWKTREKADANRIGTKKREARRGELPLCKHVNRYGKACEQRTGRPNGYCAQHDPERMAAAIRRLRSYPPQRAEPRASAA